MKSSYLLKQLVSNGWEIERSLNGGWSLCGDVGHQFGRFTIYLSIDLNNSGDFIEYIHVYYNPRDWRTQDVRIFGDQLLVPFDEQSYSEFYLKLCNYEPIFIPEKKEDIEVKLDNVDCMYLFDSDIVNKLASGHRVVLSYGD